MILSTYHVHTNLCDGKNTPEEMIRSAIACGCSEIGFSGHSAIPGEDWCMTDEGAEEYCKLLQQLKKDYEKQITVYIGIEQDSISTVSRKQYDYIIGSVHSVFRNGKYEWVDLSSDNFSRIVKDVYNGDVYSFSEDYYDEVASLYENTKCDIIGHFDLITKYIDLYPFDTSHPRYVKAYKKALGKLLSTPAIFEVNTGAISRGYRKTPYPSNEILDIIIAAGKPIVVNSDAHSVDSVAFMIKETTDELLARGARILTSMEEILKITRA